jgi:NAD+ synthase (glutamine-hydrolysing)
VESDARSALEALVLGTRDYARRCRFSGALVGLSGGIDSAVVACLAARALGPANVLGVSMPSRFSSDHSRTDAAALAAALGIEFRTISIEPMFATYLEALAPAFAGRPPDVTEENLQARIRGGILMALSNKLGTCCFPPGTRAKSRPATAPSMATPAAVWPCCRMCPRPWSTRSPPRSMPSGR